MNDKITGKQIAAETVTLAMHIGQFLSDALDKLLTDAKGFFTKRKPEEKQSKPS